MTDEKISLAHQAPRTMDDFAFPRAYREQLTRYMAGPGEPLLLYGAHGVGKSKWARFFIQESDLDDLWIDGAKGGGVETLMQAVHAMGYPSHFGQRKILVVDEIDSFGEIALNRLRGDALLPNVFYVFICNKIEKIPAAVRSRCRKIGFDLSDNEFARELKGAQRERMEAILFEHNIHLTTEQVDNAHDKSGLDFREFFRLIDDIVFTAENFTATAGSQASSSWVDVSWAEVNRSDALADTPQPHANQDLGSPLSQTVSKETADLLVQLMAVLERHVALPEGNSLVIALYILMTYCPWRFDYFALLAVLSTSKGCGKSTLMQILSYLVLNPLKCVGLTGPALFERTEVGACLLIDEADVHLKNKDVLAAINAGVEPHDSVYRAGYKEFKVFGPKIIARIGRIEPSTVESRTIQVWLTESFDKERVTTRLKEKLAPLREKCEKWAGAASELISQDPDVPTDFSGRMADKWRSLFSISDLAGPEWSHQAREAARSIESRFKSKLDVGPQLLFDIREIFTETNRTRIFTKDLVEHLRKLEERSWVRWQNPSLDISRILDDYGITSKNISAGGVQKKGYIRADFEAAFETLPKVDDLDGLDDFEGVPEIAA